MQALADELGGEDDLRADFSARTPKKDSALAFLSPEKFASTKSAWG